MPHDRNKHRALDGVVARASSDNSFRAQLLADPHGAIGREFGIRVPQTFRLKFIERPVEYDALIVLPDAEVQGGELTDDALELVRGGADDGAELFAWSDAPADGDVGDASDGGDFLSYEG
jgi:hypothetical protein